MQFYYLKDVYRSLQPGQSYYVAEMKQVDRQGMLRVPLDQVYRMQFIQLDTHTSNPGAIFYTGTNDEYTGEPETTSIATQTAGYYVAPVSRFGGKRRSKKTRKGRKSSKKTMRRRR